MFLALPLLAVMVLVYASRLLLAAVALPVSMAGTLLLLADPRLDLLDQALTQRIRPRLEVALSAVRLAAASPASRPCRARSG